MFNQQLGSVRAGGPAPIPAAELARSLAPFGQSRMLPRIAYLSQHVFDWEQANIFASWVCVGAASDLPDAGSQKAVDTPDGGLLLVRGEDQQVRAFANTCRHRGHELLPCGSATSRRAIVCPYHAWTYRLDGSLRAAPGFTDSDTFHSADYGLPQLRMVNWHGWLFVDATGAAGSFDEHVAGLDPIVSPYQPENLTVVARHSYELATNWKVIVENYQECYHCSMIHPELCQVSPPESGENLQLDGQWLAGWQQLREHAQTMSLDGHSDGTGLPGLSADELRRIMYVVGFPNLLISLHPDYVMTHLLTPLGPDRTRVECAWAFPPEVAGAPGFDPAYAVDFWDLTNRQDWAACESVQRGLSSKQATPGPLAPDEDGVYQFVGRVATAYAGGTEQASALLRSQATVRPVPEPARSQA